MIAQTLEFRHDFVILIEDRNVLLVSYMGQKLDDIPADPVGEDINGILFLHNLFINRCIVILEQAERVLYITLCSAELCEQDIIQTAQRQRRCVEEHRIEGIQFVLVFVLRLLVVRNEPDAGSLHQRDRGEQQNTCCQVKYRIGVCDHTGIDDRVPDPVKSANLMQDRDTDKNERHLPDIEENIDDTDSLLLRARTYKADDAGRHAVAQIHADDHGIHRLESQHARRGKRLQNTDRRRGTLQYERHGRTGQIAEDRIVAETVEQALHHSGFCQNIDGACHIHQAGKKDAEADGNIADLPRTLESSAHDQNNADDQRDGRKRRRFEQLQPGSGSSGVKVQETDDLSRDRCTDVRTNDNAKRLMQRQKTCADQSGSDDDRRRGRLNDRRYAQSQQKCLDRVIGDGFHGLLECSGGTLLEAVSHQACQEIKYAH